LCSSYPTEKNRFFSSPADFFLLKGHSPTPFQVGKCRFALKVIHCFIVLADEKASNKNTKSPKPSLTSKWVCTLKELQGTCHVEPVVAFQESQVAANAWLLGKQ
jgi:hypothetical protein